MSPDHHTNLRAKVMFLGVGLDPGNQAKCATGLLHEVRLAIRSGRQTKCRIGKAQVLMIQSIEHFPAKFDVLALL